MIQYACSLAQRHIWFERKIAEDRKMVAERWDNEKDFLVFNQCCGLWCFECKLTVHTRALLLVTSMQRQVTLILVWTASFVMYVSWFSFSITSALNCDETYTHKLTTGCYRDCAFRPTLSTKACFHFSFGYQKREALWLTSWLHKWTMCKYMYDERRIEALAWHMWCCYCLWACE